MIYVIRFLLSDSSLYTRITSWRSQLVITDEYEDGATTMIEAAKKPAQAVLFTLALLCACMSEAAEAPAPLASTPPASNRGASSACPGAEQLSSVHVQPLIVVDGGRAATPDSAVPVVQLRDEIGVRVSNLAVLLAHEKCSPTHSKIVVFLDGRPVASAVPFPPLDPSGEVLKFVLERTDLSRDTWTHLLGRPSFADRPLAVSVGVQDEYPLASTASIRLRTIPSGWFLTWLALLTVLAGGFVALAARSDVLRDTGPQPDASGKLRKPFSLAKMQAAWWFFLILASYLFIGLITGDYGTVITSTVLSLMGISSATVIGSATIDAGKPKAELSTVLIADGDGVSMAAPQTVAPTKGHWWLDILSDEHGVNFHRFQMASWTVVLGIIFVQQVYKGLAMPDFDNTLLGLLGISAGTYLGLKTTSEAR